MYTDSGQAKQLVWDPAKAAKNFRSHKVSFEFAKDIFFDPYAIEVYDAGHSDREDRFKILGRVSSKILLVVYLERENEIRLISARPAERAERKRYYENEKEQIFGS